MLLNPFTNSYKCDNVKNLKIFYLNANSVKHKFDKFKELLTDLKCDFDVVVLVETKLDKGTGKFYNLGDKYKSYHNIRHRSGGGSVIFVKESISSSMEFICNRDEIEFILIKLIKLNVNICSIYRTPINSLAALNKFYNKLDYILSKFKNMIIVSDTNINLLNATNRDIQLDYKNLIESNNNYSILNLINYNMATPITDTSATIIDHALTDIQDSKITFSLGENDVGDHKFIIIEIQNEFFLSLKSKETGETYNLTDSKKLSSYLKTINIATNFDNIHKEFCKKSAECTVTKIISPRNNHNNYPYYTVKLEKIRKLRNKFYKLKKNYPTVQYYKDQFKYYKYLLIKDLISEKTKFHSQQISNVLLEPRKLWQTMNEIMTGKKKTSGTNNIILSLDNVIYDDPTDVSDIINEFFSSVGVNIRKNIPLNHKYVSPTKLPTYAQKFNKFEPTTVEEIESIINNLNNNSSGGYDNIKAKFMKLNVTFFKTMLSKHINLAFETGKFPDSLKIRIVTAIFKNGDSKEVGNYRPITVLSLISKIYEICMKTRLDSFLTDNKIIHPLQFGFIKNCSTVSAISHLTDKIIASLNMTKKTSCLILDLKKAFDCLHHDSLFTILRRFGIQDKALMLIKDFFNNRKQRVKMGGYISGEVNVKIGAGQGGILSPLYFTLYINDIFYLPLIGSIQLYADDCAIVYSENNYVQLKKSMMKDLNTIYEFLLDRNLVINSSKTEFILFKTINMNKKDIFYSLPLGNETISAVSEYVFLGLVINEKLD